MRNLLQRLLAPNGPFGKGGSSKDDAKQRLKMVLIHDQVDLTPAQLEKMKNELLEVVSRYLEVDVEGMEFKLHREDGAICLVSNVPVRRVTARTMATAGA